jgi:5-methylcytosine-specific restriction endonuclease McrA
MQMENWSVEKRRKKFLEELMDYKTTPVKKKKVKQENAPRKTLAELDTPYFDWVRYEAQRHLYNQDYIDSLRSLTMTKYYETDHWNLVRKAAIGWHGNICFSCKGRLEKDIHVHHVGYERKGHEEMSDFIILCRDCHYHTHRILRLYGKA